MAVQAARLQPAKTPKSRSNGVILTFISLLLSPHSWYKIRKAKQKKKKRNKGNQPKMKQNQQKQHSVWSRQKAAWGLCRCLFNSWPDTLRTHRQRTNIVLRQQRTTGLHPELFPFLLTTRGEKRNLGYKCFIKNNSKSKSKYKSCYSSFILHRIISHF